MALIADKWTSSLSLDMFAVEQAENSWFLELFLQITALWEQYEGTKTVHLQTRKLDNEQKLTVRVHKADQSCRFGW